jgi:hypothetical protein
LKVSKRLIQSKISHPNVYFDAQETNNFMQNSKKQEQVKITNQSSSMSNIYKVENMHIRLMVLLASLLMIGSACQSGTPPTLYAIEVTRVVTVVVTPDSASDTDDNSGDTTTAPTNAAEDSNTDNTTPELTATMPATAIPTVTSTQSPLGTNESDTTNTPIVIQTSTPDVFPTPAVGQVFVAEQDFQNGRMFWLEPVDQIWVIWTNERGETIWSVYDDEFEDGMVESDPNITPPEGLYQPERGFGKLWRDNDDVRNQLGWAVQPEFGYVSRYEYRAGGIVSEDNEYVPGPGQHILETLDRKTIQFNEGIWTWQTIESSSDNN